jgi:acetate kinase
MGKNAYHLTLNAGSSSLKFAAFPAGGGAPLAAGQVERLCTDAARLSMGKDAGQPVGAITHGLAAEGAIRAVAERLGADPAAIGVRIVHGGPHYAAPALVDGPMLAALQALIPFAPAHIPAELEIIALCGKRLPDVPLVAAFDTGFHAGLPPEARTLPIPRRFLEQGVRRYGFHGLSYESLMLSLADVAGPEATTGRVILCHLGNGSSLAAVRHGQSIDTSMGFTPAAGIPMGTRSGDLDPGLMLYFSQTEGMDAKAFDAMVHAQSGLLGVSETSADMRDLLARAESDYRAQEAVTLFAYHVRKMIGAYAAALGGLDTLVFSGGIGAHAAPVRALICQGLDFAGVSIDPARNQTHAPLISTGTVAVRVIETNEEAILARACRSVLAKKDIA